MKLKPRITPELEFSEVRVKCPFKTCFLNLATWKVQYIFMRMQHRLGWRRAIYWVDTETVFLICFVLELLITHYREVLPSLWLHPKWSVVHSWPLTTKTWQLVFDVVYGSVWHRLDGLLQSLFQMKPGCKILKEEVIIGHESNQLPWQRQTNGIRETSSLKTKCVSYSKFPIIFHSEYFILRAAI